MPNDDALSSVTPQWWTPEECRDWMEVLMDRRLLPALVERLRQLAAQLERNEWQDIESAPTDGTVILYGGDSDHIIPWVSCGRWTDAGWFEINLDDSDMHGHPDYPTLWQPLPAPPEAK